MGLSGGAVGAASVIGEAGAKLSCRCLPVPVDRRTALTIPVRLTPPCVRAATCCSGMGVSMARMTRGRGRGRILLLACERIDCHC